MKAVVIGFHRGAEQTLVNQTFWVAGIFSDTWEANSFLDSVQTLAINLNQRTARLRGATFNLEYNPDEYDEAAKIYEATFKKLKKTDPELIPTSVDLDEESAAIEYVICLGETRGFYSEMEDAKED